MAALVRKLETLGLDERYSEAPHVGIGELVPAGFESIEDYMASRSN